MWLKIFETKQALVHFCPILWLYDKVRLGSKPCEFMCVLLDFPRKSTGLVLFGFVAPFLLPYGRRISFSLPCAGNLHEEKV